MQDRDYEVLANFRYTLRRFLKFSEEAAGAVGLSPQQHQALLFTRSSGKRRVTVGALAEWLQIKPHSAAELSSRLETAGLLERREDPEDRRRTLLTVSEYGTRLLESLTEVHRRELQRLKEPVRELLAMLDDDHA
ncbi:MAG: MarR family transcriptional regulator [Candidatus Eremiobacteraeota bacterium]|nr:MarR family transcriptional regulator [Candidatus Eremiobacteraeota bacterium]MCW5867938.1 MarR family transcriptional regulator [Candidatus Eremiobacteraeota bacterium]